MSDAVTIKELINFFIYIYMYVLQDLVVSILSERRAFQPYGMEGGAPGERGLNLLQRAGRVINLGGKNTVSVSNGDRLTICSPGGGGYGSHGQQSSSTASSEGTPSLARTSGSLNQYVLNQESV